MGTHPLIPPLAAFKPTFRVLPPGLTTLFTLTDHLPRIQQTLHRLHPLLLLEEDRLNAEWAGTPARKESLARSGKGGQSSSRNSLPCPNGVSLL